MRKRRICEIHVVTRVRYIYTVLCEILAERASLVAAMSSSGVTVHQKPYNVPLIPTNLRREETIKHIADTLQYLENITDDVFTRIYTCVSNFFLSSQRGKQRNISVCL